MEDTQKKPHALLVAYPLQGHIIPSINLAMTLASKGFTITLVNTEAIHHHITKAQPGLGDDIFVGARKSGLDIRYELVSDGLPLRFDRSLNHDQFMASLLHVLSAHMEELVVKMVRSDHPITCIIADTFFVWPSAIAKKYGLIYASFWTESAMVFTLYYHMDLLRKHGHFGSYNNRKDTISYIPGVRAIEPTDLPSYLQETTDTTVVHQIISKSFEDVKGADYILCNTVHELELETISALQIEKPFYAIGPIISLGNPKLIVATSLWSEIDCTKWLDTKPIGSVLYISFGSYAHISKRDLEEIAMGLLLSEVNFIWVLRPDIISSDDEDPLPAGFLEECNQKGMVVPWCQQSAVLSHPSVGGFLTHCGWNSILESVWCDIPLLCFPLLTDQFTNRKLVVDDWKIGIDIIRHPKSAVSREEVSAKIKLLMSIKLSEDLRKEIKKVKMICEDALMGDGSLQKNLDLFINDVLNKRIHNGPC